MSDEDKNIDELFIDIVLSTIDKSKYEKITKFKEKRIMEKDLECKDSIKNIIKNLIESEGLVPDLSYEFKFNFIYDENGMDISNITLSHLNIIELSEDKESE